MECESDYHSHNWFLWPLEAFFLLCTIKGFKPLYSAPSLNWAIMWIGLGMTLVCWFAGVGGKVVSCCYCFSFSLALLLILLHITNLFAVPTRRPGTRLPHILLKCWNYYIRLLSRAALFYKSLGTVIILKYFILHL